MGKATDLENSIRPLTPEEMEKRLGPRPKLRLRPDVVAQALDSNAGVQDVLHRLDQQGPDGLTVLHDAASGAAAVTIPLDRYLSLVTSDIRDRQLTEANFDGRIGPSDATLSAMGVEQVNPRDTWLPIPSYDPGGPAPDS